MNNNLYDKNNIFYKIIYNEIPSSMLYEDDALIAIHDKNPKAPVHILIICKKLSVNYSDFISNSSADEIVYFFTKVHKLAYNYCKNNSYKLIINTGEIAGQTIFHFHVHVLSGKILEE